jgi:hypothetical protein
MLYFGSLASSGKPMKRRLPDGMFRNFPQEQSQEWLTNTFQAEKNSKYLPIEYDWRCPQTNWRGRIKLVAKHTCCVKTTSYYYGTVLHSWNALLELCRSRCRGSRLCEFR